MSIADKWFAKSLKSFQSGNNDYKSIREFSNCLQRVIEFKEFQKLEGYFNQVLPILEKKLLFHELEQILSNFLKHSTKHKVLLDSFSSLFNISSSFFEKSIHETSNPYLISTLLNYGSSVSDSELNRFLKNNYESLLDKAAESEFLLNLRQKLFETFVKIRFYDQAYQIADPFFFHTVETSTQLRYTIYSTLILALNDLEEAKKKVLEFRKTLDKEYQNDEIFKFGSELILASSSQDSEFFFELKNYFGSQLQEKVLVQLVNELEKKYFKSDQSRSILDLFKK